MGLARLEVEDGNAKNKTTDVLIALLLGYHGRSCIEVEQRTRKRLSAQIDAWFIPFIIQIYLNRI